MGLLSVGLARAGTDARGKGCAPVLVPSYGAAATTTTARSLAGLYPPIDPEAGRGHQDDDSVQIERRGRSTCFQSRGQFWIQSEGEFQRWRYGRLSCARRTRTAPGKSLPTP